MNPFAQLTPIARRNVLAVIMLVILLALTAAAWVISTSISPLREGETWYLIREGDQPVGWQVVQRETVVGGAGRGYDMQFFARSSRGLWSIWRLDAARRSGRYLSGAIAAQPIGLDIRPQTRIEYDAPRLAITPIGGPVRRIIEVGPDYIPEGHLYPTVADVARTGETVEGLLAVDDRLAVVPVILEREGLATHTLNGRQVDLTAVRLTWPSSDVDVSPRRLLVDDDGSIVVIELLDAQGGVILTFTRATLEQVRQQYPRAHYVRNQLLETTQPQ